jgi:pimeloyl-ACP methyl ester carboxylesterase
LAHALERVVDASFDQTHPLCGKIDLTRISVVGHSFGGAAAVMLAQMDPRVTSVVALDPWMWPLGRESSLLGCPCPLLVFEAPEFMWNRDIFCVTNSECSSLMCAATAPQAVTGSASHGETKKAHGASGREGSFAVSRDACQETSQSERAAGTGDATVTVTGVGASTGPSSFQTAFGATADTLATEDTADTFPDSTRSQTASPFHDFPRDDEESTRGSSSFAKSTTSSELTEDQTKSPPGFVGNAIDGHAG